MTFINAQIYSIRREKVLKRSKDSAMIDKTNAINAVPHQGKPKNKMGINIMR